MGQTVYSPTLRIIGLSKAWLFWGPYPCVIQVQTLPLEGPRSLGYMKGWFSWEIYGKCMVNIPFVPWIRHGWCPSGKTSMSTLLESSISPEEGPFWEETSSSNHQISGDMLVSGSVNSISSWWLSFNPFEKYAQVKLDHETPRIGVTIKIFELPPLSEWVNSTL